MSAAPWSHDSSAGSRSIRASGSASLYAAESDPIEARYLSALQTALPHATPDSVAFGYVNMLGLLALHQSQALSRTPGLGEAEDPGKLAENLIAFLVAAFDQGLRS